MEAPPGEDSSKTNNPHMSALAALTTPPPPPPETASSAPPLPPVDSQNYPQAGVPIDMNVGPQSDALSPAKSRQAAPPAAGYYDPAYGQYYGNPQGQYQAPPPNAGYWGANTAAPGGYQQSQPGPYNPAMPQQQYPGAYPQQPYGSSGQNSYGYPAPNAPGPRGQYETPGSGGYRPPYNQQRPNYPPHHNYQQSRYPNNSAGGYGPPPGQNDARGPPFNIGTSGSGSASSTGNYSPPDSSNPLMQPQHSPRGPNVPGGPNASGNSFNYRPPYPSTNSYRPRFAPQNSNQQNNNYRSNYPNEAGGRNVNSGTSNNTHSPGSRDRDNRDISASSQQNSQSPSKPSNSKKTTLPPSQWPEGLQSFVQRSFKACVSETAKDLTEKELKTFIPKVFEDGSVHKINWEKHPLPECVTVKSPDRSRGRSSSSSRGRSPDNRNDRRKRSDRASKRSPPDSRHSRRSDRDRRRSRSRDRGGDSKRYSSKKRHNRSDSESSYESRRSSDEEVMRAGNRSKRRYDPSNASSSRDDYNDQRNRNDYFEGRGKRNNQPGRGGKYVDRDDPDDDYHKSGGGDQQTDVRSRLSNRGRGRGGKDQFSDGASGSQQTGSESDQFGGRGRGRGGRGRGKGQNNWQQRNSDDNRSGENSQDSGFQSNRGGRGKGRGRGFKPDTTISQNVDTFDENDPRLKARAARFQMQGGNQDNSASVSTAKVSENGAGSSPMPIKMSDLPDTSGNDDDVVSGDAIVGTSKSITKNYLRLTEAPDPSSVRPKEVLKKSLEYIKDHWKKNKDYMYVCDQLRSVRQDLTVQCIRDDFTVTVYETHARVAIEQGDYQEFNQCQTQLKSLYDAGLPGACWEFTAYRLHYYIFTNAPNDCIHYMRTLTEEGKSQEVVNHAVNVFKSWAHGNYVAYFKLYRNAPLMSGYMMDLVLDRERKKALKLVCKVYKPTIEISYLTNVLAFEDADACVAFLVGQGYSTENNSLDCRKAPNPL